MSKHANKALKKFKKADAVRRAEGSPPEGEGRVGPGRMASVGSRFISELFNPVEAGKDVANVGRSYLDLLSAYNTFLYQRSPEEQLAFLRSLPGKTREALGSAATALQSLPETAKRAVETATPESTAAAVRRFGVEATIDPTRLVKGAGPATSQIIRPRGEGIVLDNPNATAVELEKNQAPTVPTGYIPRAIAKGQERIRDRYAGLPEANRAAIENFLQTKVRNYYARQFGTQDDPIYKAIREGRLTSDELGKAGGIRKYLTDVAKEGKTRVDPETGETRFYPSPNAQEAIEDINRLYDRMTNMRGTVLTGKTVGDPKFNWRLSETAREDFRKLEAATRDRLLEERLRPQEINPSISYVGYQDPSQVKPGGEPRNLISYEGAYPSADTIALFLSNPEQRRFMPKGLLTAMEKDQPVYDMSPSGALEELLDERLLVDYLSTLEPNQINNMRFEDAIRGSAKFQVLKNERKVLVSRIKDNKPVDSKVFLEGVSAPLISYPEGSPLAGYTWRRLEKPEATELEGAYIGHSVGGYADDGSYTSEKKKAFREGTTKIYSLRDPRGFPVTTVEIQEVRGLGPVAQQVRGAGRATGNDNLSKLEADRLALATNYVDPALVDLFKTLGVVRIQEYASHLGPLAKAMSLSIEQEFKKKHILSPTLQARVGEGQPVGGLPPQPQPAPRPQPPPEQQGIGQLPRALRDIPNDENFARGMNDPQLIEFVRRLFRDQD